MILQIYCSLLRKPTKIGEIKKQEAATMMMLAPEVRLKKNEIPRPSRTKTMLNRQDVNIMDFMERLYFSAM